jgi:hypothetical protein
MQWYALFSGGVTIARDFTAEPVESAEPTAARPDGTNLAPDAAPSASSSGRSGSGRDQASHAPQGLANTDWLHHRLSITERAGAGTVPWHLDLDRIEEDCFHLLAAPPTPQRRTLSLPGARILAGQLRAAVARRHELAVARVGMSRARPFDLHALVPVPEEMLRLGPDDPAALAWLWEHWGTTHALRQVVKDAGEAERRPPGPGDAVFCLTFWSADWTPWRALGAAAARWPSLRFDIRPSYDPP